jgi:hypothetical protein
MRRRTCRVGLGCWRAAYPPGTPSSPPRSGRCSRTVAMRWRPAPSRWSPCPSLEPFAGRGAIDVDGRADTARRKKRAPAVRAQHPMRADAAGFARRQGHHSAGAGRCRRSRRGDAVGGSSMTATSLWRGYLEHPDHELRRVKNRRSGPGFAAHIRRVQEDVSASIAGIGLQQGIETSQSNQEGLALGLQQGACGAAGMMLEFWRRPACAHVLLWTEVVVRNVSIVIDYSRLRKKDTSASPGRA